MRNVKINITSSQTGLQVNEGLKNSLEKHVNSCSQYLFFVSGLSLFCKRLDKLFCFVFLENTFRYILYIYYIVIINNIYNNKNEDCIGKKWIFSNINVRKVDFLPKSNVTSPVHRRVPHEF